jgi:hypothetical protein
VISLSTFTVNNRVLICDSVFEISAAFYCQSETESTHNFLRYLHQWLSQCKYSGSVLQYSSKSWGGEY